MKAFHKLLPILFVPLIILVSGCISGLDAESLAKASPIVQDFLEDHPNAEIIATHFTANQSSQILEEIREECANPMLEAKEYYRIRFTDPDTGLLAVVWIDWVERSVECAYKEGGSLPEQIEDCKPRAHARCYGQHVYWFDSCGYKQEKREFCPDGCREGRCINKKTCEEMDGHCVYPTTTSSSATGLITGKPTAIAGCTKSYKCPNGVLVRHCEEVKKFDDKGNFIGVGCVCKDHPEYQCPDEAPGGTIKPVVISTNMCEDGFHRTDNWCPDNGVCCAPGEVQCRSRAEQRCYEGHVYWYNSCGHKQEKKEYCSHGCELGFCKTKEQFCGRSTEGPCQSDDDCVKGGCSSHVCQSVQEDPLTTTCTYKDCYDAEKYYMECICVENECRWMKNCPVISVICESGSEIETYIDEYGCEITKCIPKTYTCSDSDGGKNYYEKGTVTKGDGSWTDHCNQDGTLTEKYCLEGEVKAVAVECEEGYECDGGRCVGIPMPGCAEQGEQFSWVYTNEYPEHCCEGLTEWEEGMDTRISVADECYDTGLVSGNPVGRCIECGNQACEDYENPCNCYEDCAGEDMSDFLTVDAFCDDEWGYAHYCDNVDELNSELCSICETNQTEEVRTFEITNESYCSNGTMMIEFKNTGTVNIETEHITTSLVDSVDVSQYLEMFNVEPLDYGLFLEAYDCGGSCSAGSHTLHFATADHAENTTISC